MAVALSVTHHHHHLTFVPEVQWRSSSNPLFLSTSPRRICHSPPLRLSLVTASRSSESKAASSSSQLADEAVGVDTLRRFVSISTGNWNGYLYQFDAQGNLLHTVSTRLAASSYGEDELLSLIQTLYIKQAPCRTSFSGSDDNGEPEWAEYKIKETNMFTVDKYQQIGFFPDQKAFSLRYQTAGMLETVLRAGVLGEDDTGEESPRNLKLPSRRPSLVCENCLYSLNKNIRARAFHIMDPKGFLEMLLVFIEQTGDVFDPHPSKFSESRLSPFLGRWEGYSITKRSGVYGATISEADTIALLEIDDQGQLIQDITSTNRGGLATNILWTGRLSNNLITFDGGYKVTLLPGGMYMGCPSDVSKSVANSQSFHLEFCWVESAYRRQRLVRTYDAEGLAVSSTYFYEVKV